MEIEKVLVRKEMMPEEEWVEIGKLPDGQKIMCKKHISYGDKESLALGLASLTVVRDYKNEACYISYKKTLIETTLFVAYYTNLEVESEDSSEDVMNFIFNYVVSSGIYDAMMDVIKPDLEFVYEIYYNTCDVITTLFDGDYSLSGKVKKTFSSILDGEDMIDSIAKTEEVTGKIEELLRTYQAAQVADIEKGVIPIKDGVLNIGGKQFDLRKKELEE